MPVKLCLRKIPQLFSLFRKILVKNIVTHSITILIAREDDTQRCKGQKRKPAPPSQSSVMGCADKPFYYQPKTSLYSQITLKIAIASNIVLDTIQTADGKIVQSAGGPACYCGLTSRRFGFNVELVSKVGSDFPEEFFAIFQNNDIILGHKSKADAPTTKFRISSQGNSRHLSLIDKCEPITVQDIQNTKVDCWLASPVMDELPLDVLAAIKQNRGKKNFLMLDPQGYIRSADYSGYVTLRNNLELDLTDINAIKVDDQELAALSGGLRNLDGMKALQSKGIEFIIHTECEAIHLLHERTHYWVSLHDIDTLDPTGAGDILSASFSCSYLKEKDPLWAICFGAAAVSAALETRQVGLAKIPSMPKIEEIASYFYNAVGFQRLS
jgi:sugar/nucleoside kinase (ribokinase family)